MDGRGGVHDPKRLIKQEELPACLGGARIKQEPVDDYEQVAVDPQIRIADLQQQLDQAVHAHNEEVVSLRAALGNWISDASINDNNRLAAETAVRDEKRKYQSLELELKELHQKYVEALNEASERRNRAKEMEVEKNVAIKEMEELRRIGEELETEKDTIEKEKTDLKKDFDELRAKWEEKAIDESMNNCLQASLNNTTARMAESEKQRDELEESLKEARVIMTGLQSALSTANERLEQETTEKLQFMGERDIFEARCKNGRSENRKEDRRDTSQGRRDANKLHELRKDNDKLQERVDRYKKRARDSDRIKEKLEDAEKEVDRLSKELERTKEELSSRLEEAARDYCEALKKQRNELQTEIDQLREREKEILKEAEESRQSVASAGREKTEMRTKLTDLVKKQAGMIQTQMDNVFLKKRLEELEKIIEDRKEEDTAMRKKAKKVVEENARMEKREEKLKRRYEEVEKMQWEADEKAKKLEKMEKKMEKERAKAEKEMKRYIAVAAEYEQRLQAMEEEQEKMKQAETASVRVRCKEEDEKEERIAELTKVNAFLLEETSAGKLYVQLEQLHAKTISMMTSTWDEEGKGEDGASRKRRREYGPEPKQEETEEEGDGSQSEGLQEEEMHDEELEQPLTPVPAFLQEFIAVQEAGYGSQELTVEGE